MNRILFCVLVLTSSALAGKYAAEFLSVGAGGRALGMGGAFVAVADDASAAYWNPAGLVSLEHRELHVMHAARFSGMVQSDVAQLVLPSQTYALAASYIRMGIDDIPYTSKLDPNGRPVIDRYVSDTEQAAMLSFASRRGNLAWGATLKGIRQSVGDNTSLGFGVDLGLLYRPNSQWSLGASVQDISGTYIYWDTGHRDVKAPNLLWGAAYQKSFLFLRSSILLSVQHNIRFEGNSEYSSFNIGTFGNSDVHAGAEYTIFDSVAFRVGWYGSDLTAGAGLSFKMLRLDYAFMTYDLGNAHRISLSVEF